MWWLCGLFRFQISTITGELRYADAMRLLYTLEDYSKGSALLYSFGWKIIYNSNCGCVFGNLFSLLGKMHISLLDMS